MTQIEALSDMVKAAHSFCESAKRAATTSGEDDRTAGQSAMILRSMFLDLLNEVPNMSAVLQVPALRKA